MESTFAGTINEKGFINNLYRKGFTFSKCLSEIHANSIDANASNIIYEITKTHINVIDDGNGMNKKDATHSVSIYGGKDTLSANTKSIGISGIGLKASTFILGNRLSVIIYTKSITDTDTNTQHYTITIPWDTIFAKGIYTNQIIITHSTLDEISEFNKDRIKYKMKGTHGTTIKFIYNKTFADELKEQFEIDKYIGKCIENNTQCEKVEKVEKVVKVVKVAKIVKVVKVMKISKDTITDSSESTDETEDITNNKITKAHIIDPIDKLYITYGHFPQIVKYHHFEMPSIEDMKELPKYKYFDIINDTNYYKGIDKHQILCYTNNNANANDNTIDNDNIKYILNYGTEALEIVKSSGGYSTKPDPVCTNLAKWKLIGEFNIYTGCRTNIDYFDSNNLPEIEPSAKEYICAYDRNYISKEHKNFIAKCHIYRNDQLIGTYEMPGRNSARSNGENYFKYNLVHCNIQYYPTNNIENKLDTIIGVQENKTQLNGVMPKQLSRLIEFVKAKKGEQIWKYFQDCIKAKYQSINITQNINIPIIEPISNISIIETVSQKISSLEPINANLVLDKHLDKHLDKQLDKQPIANLVLDTHLDKQPIANLELDKHLDKQPIANLVLDKQLDKQPIANLELDKHLDKQPIANLEINKNLELNKHLELNKNLDINKNLVLDSQLVHKQSILASELRNSLFNIIKMTNIFKDQDTITDPTYIYLYNLSQSLKPVKQ